jgi:hypothetical protein
MMMRRIAYCLFEPSRGMVVGRAMEALMVSKAFMSLAILFSCLTSAALAQQRVGPVYPQNKSNNNYGSAQSGYDPFRFNWSTGRWDYVPIPYDIRSGPFAFNWHSGRWDYAPTEFTPSNIYTGREPERERQREGPTVATVPGRTFPSFEQANVASATMQPTAPNRQINRPVPAISSRAMNYTTSDPNFDDWYRSSSK